MTKRLYTVSVEFDFPVMAESERDALSHVDEAARDMNLQECATVKHIHFTKDGSAALPYGYDSDSLVYGTPGYDVTLKEAIELEKRAAVVEQSTGRQLKLFET